MLQFFQTVPGDATGPQDDVPSIRTGYLMLLAVWDDGC